MIRYGQTLRNKAVARRLPPECEAVADVTREKGGGVAKLERWRERIWAAIARFDALLSTAAMDKAAQRSLCPERPGTRGQRAAELQL